MMRQAIALAAFALAVAAQSSPDGGQSFDKRCGGCHAVDRDKEGPRLGGVYGRRAGTLKSFDYSKALKAAKVEWNSETLDRWLADTESVVPGNDMSFRVASAAERQAIIEYLKSLK